jgi:hypothetical protein
VSHGNSKIPKHLFLATRPLWKLARPAHSGESRQQRSSQRSCLVHLLQVETRRQHHNPPQPQSALPSFVYPAMPAQLPKSNVARNIRAAKNVLQMTRYVSTALRKSSASTRSGTSIPRLNPLREILWWTGLHLSDAAIHPYCNKTSTQICTYRSKISCMTWSTTAASFEAGHQVLICRLGGTRTVALQCRATCRRATEPP